MRYKNSHWDAFGEIEADMHKLKAKTQFLCHTFIDPYVVYFFLKNKGLLNFCWFWRAGFVGWGGGCRDP